ncbi:hypothetical protein R3P38DRAFT_2499377 [Favolaschia claudopus]|uniref:Uncharacterized protein n=1 Tax=Favolaschia claudopus TaxID=2862362 RepID=A0AAW0DXH7_9AGAR
MLAGPATFAERQTRAVEWGALMERRRKAGERAMVDAREAEMRREAGERWVREWGAPVGRGVRVWGRMVQSLQQRLSQNGDGSEMETEVEVMGKGDGEETDVDVDAPAEDEVEMDVVDSEGEGEVERMSPSPEAMSPEEEYGRMRRRSPLCIVSVPVSPVALPDSQEKEEQPGEAGTETGLVGKPEGEGPEYEMPPSPSPAQPQMGGYVQATEDDLGPDPATRMNTGWGPWKIACRMRVWDVRQRYTSGLIRSLVAQEADDYFSARGLPHPDALLFMDEEYYDWELEDSASEAEDGDSGEDEGESSFEVDPQQSFAMEPRSPSAGPPDEKEGSGTDGEMDLSGNGMGGVLSSFYVAPSPPPSPQDIHAHGTMSGHGQGFSQQQMIPLPLPPPPLASVRVPALRHLFTDIPISPSEGSARGRGTPVDPSRKAVWTGGKAEDFEVAFMGAGAGRGTLERRLPHPKPRPHPMYLAMTRAAEEGVPYGNVDGVSEGGELPQLPRIRDPGEMLPMRGAFTFRGEGEEEGSTPEERRERQRQELVAALEPDEAVWQEFLKSVGVENTAAVAASSVGRADDADAMDVDPPRTLRIGTDSDIDYDEESGGGGGGTSGGVALGLRSAGNSPLNSSSSGSMLSSGMEMGMGMFGMAMGVMGMGGWFSGPPSPPVPVTVGDVGDRERDRESSLSFALGV